MLKCTWNWGNVAILGQKILNVRGKRLSATSSKFYEMDNLLIWTTTDAIDKGSGDFFFFFRIFSKNCEISLSEN